jgi:hypothetical protein
MLLGRSGAASAENGADGADEPFGGLDGASVLGVVVGLVDGGIVVFAVSGVREVNTWLGLAGMGAGVGTDTTGIDSIPFAPSTPDPDTVFSR